MKREKKSSKYIMGSGADGVLERYGCFAVFLLAFLPRMVFIFTSTYPLSIGGDEIFQFMPIAKLVGWDWSGVAEDYRYYGYGFFVLLTPLFKIVSDPLVLYRCIVSLFVLLQALVAPLAYRIMRDFYSISDTPFLVLGATACSYFVTVRAVYTYNEHVYIFIVWLIAAALLKLEKNVDNTSGKRKWTLVVLLLMVYAMTLHSRAVALWIALLAGIFAYFIVYRKWVVSWAVLGGIGILGYGGAELAKRLVINSSISDGAAAVNNVSVSFDISSIFYSSKSILGWVYIIIGQLSTLMVFTGGFAVFCLVVGIYKLLGTLLKRLFPKWKLGEYSQSDSQSFFLLTVMLAAVVITILGQSFSWLWGVADGLERNKEVDSYRAFTYLRYFGVYFGPILMLGLVWLKKEHEAYCRCIGAIFTVGWLLQLIWCTYILPYISSFTGTVWDYAPYSLTHGWTDKLSRSSYIVGTAAALLLSYIIYFLAKHKKGTIVAGILACLLLYEYCYNAVYHEGWRGKTNYEFLYDSCQVMDALADQEVLPDHIYVDRISHPVTGQGTGYIYQFMLPEQRIIFRLPEEDEVEEASAVLTVDGNLNEKLAEQGYWFVWLGESQYIYVKGEQLQQALLDLGMTRLY